MKTILLFVLVVISGCGSGKDVYVPSVDAQRAKAGTLVVGSSTTSEVQKLIGAPDDVHSTYDGTADRNPNEETSTYHFRGGDLKITMRWTCLDISGSCLTNGAYDGHRPSDFFFKSAE